MRGWAKLFKIQIRVQAYYYFDIGGEKISEFNLSLMNLDSENLGIPDTEFSSICTMPSTEFNRICREFGSLSETIKIETNK